MAPKYRKGTPEREWEEALLTAYYDYRWHEILDPLYDKMQLWKKGELTHDDINQTVHKTHKETQRLWGFYTNNREFIISIAQATGDWFKPWLAQHHAPPGMPLKEPIAEPESAES